MKQQLLMAIDIGTTNSKAALFSLDGRLIASAGRRHTVDRPDELRAQHDAEKVWWAECQAICKELTGRSDIDVTQILAVSVSSLSPAVLPIDQKGNALYPAMLYGLDRRAHKEMEELGAEWNDYLLSHGEGAVSPLSTGPKILWLKRNEPEIFQKTAYFVGVPSFLVYRLTGNMVADYGCYRIAGFPYSREKMDWDDKMCAACGVRRDQLPPLHYATECAGRITQAAAQCTGLRAGTPVAVGTGDFLAETLSYGTNFKNSIQMSFGTTVGVDMGTDHCSILFPGYTPAIHKNAIPGGAMSNGCSTVDWMISVISGVDVKEPLEDTRLCEMANSVPAGSDGLIVLPYLNGEKKPFLDPKARGMLFGLRMGHTQAHLYKAALEGLAYSIRHCLCVFHPEEKRREAVVMGGGTRIPMLLQVVSDVTGFRLKRLEIYNGTLLGDAFLAAMAGGIFTKREDINAWIQVSDCIEPRPENKEIYDKGYQTYLDLYQATAEIMQR